jgi:hypothetical protein
LKYFCTDEADADCKQGIDSEAVPHYAIRQNPAIGSIEDGGETNRHHTVTLATPESGDITP